MNEPRLRELAKDLTKTFPRSPREMIGGYVIAARTLDKCRATLLGINGEYNYWPCSLAARLFDFTGLTHEQLRDLVATGASDEEVGEWLKQNSRIKDRTQVIEWNNKLRDMRLSDLLMNGQEYLEDYIQTLPKHRPIYVWFDVFDLEEGRL